MATARPFAYNTGSPIPGTEQIGDLSIGAPLSGFTDNPQFWNGPDEELGYVIGYTVTTGDQPNPVGIPAYVQFWRSKLKTNESFLELANYIGLKNGQPPFATTSDAEIWLEGNGYWTSFTSITPTPTSTVAVTPTNTPTLTPTPTTTDLSSVTTFTISGCTNLNVLVADLGPSALAPGDVFNLTFTGGTPSGCYRIVEKTVATPTDGASPLLFYVNCAACEATLVTPTPTTTSTPTPSVTNTQTPSVTPTLTPTPSTSPIPVTGYGFNLIVLPYNFPATGNTIMTSTSPSQTGTTNPNEMTSIGRGIYFNSIDTDGIDRTNYFSQFTGQSITITMSQTGSTAIYSGDTNAFKYWSANTGTLPGIAGDGFVFGTGISVPPITGFTGTTVLIQSATTNWVTGQTVYISAEINVGVTPTPTATSTNTPTPSVTNTQTPSVTPTLTQTPTNTETTTPTPTLTQTPTPTSAATAPFSVSFVESGSNVLLSYSGILDLTGLNFVQNTTSGSGGVGPTQGAFGIGPTGALDISLYTGATFSYPSNFGTGGGSPSSVTGTGDYFGVFSGLYPTNTLVVPSGYTSGNYIQGTTTLSASTFSSLGMSAGTYNYSWGAGAGQSFVLTIGGTGVTPTPTATSVTPTPTPTSGASGNFNILVSQVGPNVVWSGSGSFNLTSLTFDQNIPGVSGGYNKTFAQFIVGPSSATSATTYSGSSFTTFPTSFGSGGGTPPSSSSGSFFGVVQTAGPSGPRVLLVPPSYVSGTVISGSMTYNSQTITGLGLSGGTYTWAWGSGGSASSIVMTITP